MKSQTRPAASATNAVEPSAARASAAEGKVSIRQKSGPGGNSATRFSASGLTTRGGACCAAAGEGSDGPPRAKTVAMPRTAVPSPRRMALAVVANMRAAGTARIAVRKLLDIALPPYSSPTAPSDADLKRAGATALSESRHPVRIAPSFLCVGGLP